MARKNNHRKKSFTLPLAVVAGFAMPISRAFDATTRTGGNWRDGVGELVRDFTGYKPWVGGWDWTYLKLGLFPVIAGMTIHKLVSALGVNRALSAAGIPVIRI